MDSLKAQLGITPAQEPAWKQYATTAIGMSAQMQGVGQNMRDSMQTATPQERRDTMAAMSGAREMAHNSVHEAALKLLPALTPEQRQKAASILPGLVAPGPMGQGRGGGGPGMGPGYMRNQPPPG
jgi:hypothetical protein